MKLGELSRKVPSERFVDDPVWIDPEDLRFRHQDLILRSQLQLSPDRSHRFGEDIDWCPEVNSGAL